MKRHIKSSRDLPQYYVQIYDLDLEVNTEEWFRTISDAKDYIDLFDSSDGDTISVMQLRDYEDNHRLLYEKWVNKDLKPDNRLPITDYT